MKVLNCPFCKSPGEIVNSFSCVWDFPFDGNVFWHGNQYVKCTNQKCGATGGKNFVTTKDKNGSPDMNREDVQIAIERSIKMWNRRV